MELFSVQNSFHPHTWWGKLATSLRCFGCNSQKKHEFILPALNGYWSHKKLTKFGIPHRKLLTQICHLISDQRHLQRHLALSQHLQISPYSSVQAYQPTHCQATNDYLGNKMVCYSVISMIPYFNSAWKPFQNIIVICKKNTSPWLFLPSCCYIFSSGLNGIHLNHVNRCVGVWGFWGCCVWVWYINAATVSLHMRSKSRQEWNSRSLLWIETRKEIQSSHPTVFCLPRTHYNSLSHSFEIPLKNLLSCHPF